MELTILFMMIVLTFINITMSKKIDKTVELIKEKTKPKLPLEKMYYQLGYDLQSGSTSLTFGALPIFTLTYAEVIHVLGLKPDEDGNNNFLNRMSSYIKNKVDNGDDKIIDVLNIPYQTILDIIGKSKEGNPLGKKVWEDYIKRKVDTVEGFFQPA